MKPKMHYDFVSFVPKADMHIFQQISLSLFHDLELEHKDIRIELKQKAKSGHFFKVKSHRSPIFGSSPLK